MKIHGPTTQCNSKTYYQMFQLSTSIPNLCPQPKSSLINHLINDRLLDVWPTAIQSSDVASIHQYLAQNFNRPAPEACNLRSKVWNVKKSQVGHHN